MKKIQKSSITLLTAALGLFVLSPQAQATDRTWTGGGTDNYWSTPDNWGGTPPAVAGDSMIFSGTARQNNTNDYPALTNGPLAFNSAGWTLNGNIFAQTGNITNVVGTNVINNDIMFGTNYPRVLDYQHLISISAGSELHFNGSLYGASEGHISMYFNMQLPGTAVISGDNSGWYGRWILNGSASPVANAGFIRFTSPLAPGNGQFQVYDPGLAGGTVQFDIPGPGVNIFSNAWTRFPSSTGGAGAVPQIENLAGTNVITGNLVCYTTGGNGIGVKATGGLIDLAGEMYVDFNSARTITLMGNGNGIVDGVIRNDVGNFTVMKWGAGTWTLNNTNDSTGAVRIFEGTLAFGPNGAWDNAPYYQMYNPDVTLDVSAVPGGFTIYKQLNGQGTIIGDLILATNCIWNIGASGGAVVGTLVCSNNLTLEGANPMDWDLSADPTGLISPNDQVNVKGNLTATGVNTFFLKNYLDGYLTNGTYTLITFDGTLTGSAANFAVTNFTYEKQGGYIVANPHSIDLVVTGTPPATLTWVGDGGANYWDIETSSNWFNGTGLDTYADLDTVTFDDSSTNGSVTILSPVAPGGVTVNNTNTDYEFTSGSASIDGTINFYKEGSGKLTLGSDNTFTGYTYINGGTVSVNSVADQGTASPIGEGGVWANGGTLEYTGGDVTADLHFYVNTNGATIQVDDANATLSLTGGGHQNEYGNVLTKTGPGTLAFPLQETLDGTNIILGGVFRIPTVNLFGGNYTIPVYINGGALDINGQTMSTKPVVAQGLGDLTLGATNGAIISSSGSQANGLEFVTLTGDTAFGGNGSWDIRGAPTATLSTGGNAYNLLKVGNGRVGLADVTVDAALANIEVRTGTLSYELGTTGLGNPADTLSVDGFANFRMNAAVNALDKQVVLYDYSTNVVVAGNNTISGPVSMPGDSFGGPVFNVLTNATLNISGLVSGAGSLTKNGDGTLNLSNTNTYGGPTTVNAGKLVVSSAQTGTGDITVADGATLGVTVSGTSQLQPNNLSLGYGASSVTMEFNGVNSTTVAPVSATSVYGTSTLVVNVPTGTLTAGNDYPLIQAGSSFYGSLVLGETPPYVAATLTNISGSIYLHVTSVSATYETWTGNQNGTWDINTTTNWSSGGSPAVYTDGDAVLFDDTGSNTTVSISTTVSPAGVAANNNAKDYALSGSAIAGTGNLLKQGSGALTLSSANSYSGGTTLADGTLNINNSDALGTGGVTINGGTIDDNGAGPVTLTNAQTWNANFGYGGNQSITVSGDVALGSGSNVQVTAASGFGTLNVNGVISDAGMGRGVIKAGGGSMTLAGTNTYTGGTTVSAGTLTLQGDQSGATGGLAVGTASTGGTLAIAAGANVVVPSGKQIQVGNTGATGTATVSLNVAGSVTDNGGLLAARTSAIDVGTNGQWLQAGDMEVRGVGGLNGTITTESNSVFTYTGANTIKLNGADGNYGEGLLDVSGLFVTGVGFEQTTTLTTTGYGQLSLLNGGTLQLSANVPVLATNGVQVNVGTGGGTIDTAGFDAGLDVGISGAGSLTKAGAGTLSLESTNTYTGDTLVSGGTLALTNAASLASTNVLIAGGATLDVSGLGAPLTLSTNQTLGNSSSTGLLNGSADDTQGSLALTYASGTPALSVANGALTLDAATPVTVDNTGAALGNGSYKLISAGSAGSVAGTVPGAVMVTGSGLGYGASASLSLVSSELYLDVTGAIAENPTNIVATVSAGQLTLSWPSDHTGWTLQTQTNALNVGISTNWVAVPGSTTTNSVTLTIDPNNPTVFFRMILP